MFLAVMCADGEWSEERYRDSNGEEFTYGSFHIALMLYMFLPYITSGYFSIMKSALNLVEDDQMLDVRCPWEEIITLVVPYAI